MRYNHLPLIITVNGMQIYRNNIPWQSFPYETGYRIHHVTDNEKLRTWSISQLWYNTTDYDDVIFLINNIQDVWNIPDGYELKIPAKQELDLWLQKFAV